VQIMNEWITLYRGEGGTPHAVAFRCGHRGTQLSVGWVEDDCIRCRYHGWMYDAGGQCVEQPGEDPAAAARVKIRAYPTQEYMGLIFAYLGEGEPPPIKRFPDFENDPRLMVGPTQPWPCNYFNRIDNALDPLHVAFTHSEALTRVNRTSHLEWRSQGTAVSAEETEYGLCASVTMDGRHSSTIHFHMPNINQLGIEAPSADEKQQDGASPWGDRLFWRVPIDDEHCTSYVVGIMMAPGGEGSRRLVEPTNVSPNDMAEDILGGKLTVEQIPGEYTQRDMFWVEDYVAQVGQGAIQDRSNERLGRRDMGLVALRRVWERELRAVAEGRPLKQWESTGGLRTVW
jgi:5,5'-dehydrodivanillate O-demethylase